MVINASSDSTNMTNISGKEMLKRHFFSKLNCLQNRTKILVGTQISSAESNKTVTIKAKKKQVIKNTSKYVHTDSHARTRTHTNEVMR